MRWAAGETTSRLLESCRQPGAVRLGAACCAQLMVPKGVRFSSPALNVVYVFTALCTLLYDDDLYITHNTTSTYVHTYLHTTHNQQLGWLVLFALCVAAPHTQAADMTLHCFAQLGLINHCRRRLHDVPQCIITCCVHHASHVRQWLCHC